jgi:hypothetical protein
VKLTSPLSSAEVKNPLRLHSIVLIYLSTGIILPFFVKGLCFKALQLYSMLNISYPSNRPWRPTGPQEDSWYSFLLED